MDFTVTIDKRFKEDISNWSNPGTSLDKLEEKRIKVTRNGEMS